MDLVALAGDPTSEPDDLAEAVDAAAGDATAYSTVLGLVDHDARAVRTAVARTLPHLAIMQPNEPFLAFAVDALLSLSADPDGEVRNWACFGLGTQLDDVDGPQVREALVARLRDPHGEARREAMIGLAKRRDPRALPAVRSALRHDDVWLLEVEAAGALGDPSLHELVLRHVEGWDGAAARMVAAVVRLTDPAGVGEDLLDGLAEWYRNGGSCRPDTDPWWWRVSLDLLEVAEYRAAELAAAVDARLVGDAEARAVLASSALAQMARQHGWSGA
ncbi:MAG TPA: HEAT repeat domain-containing protein [Cryptosporangiaceae bacterium]|nr:HEAT repeat domain-containing protein [Cryptosporangiaceae bacterium]